VVDGESGLLFPAGDFRKLAEHLLLLRTSRDLRRQIGQQALRRVREEFSIDSMVGNYQKLYESLQPAAAGAIRAAAGI
jgi:glycosyltransferase involved in cell wall biosynthesis